MMRSSFNLKYVIITLLFCWNLISLAATQSPLPLLKETVAHFIAVLDRNPTESGIKQHVVEKLLPIIDRNYMARLIVGRQYWRSASVAQRRVFMQELTELLLDTYTTVWLTYNDEHIEFAALRPGDTSHTRVKVKSWIISGDGERIAVNYRMYRVLGEWKIYDLDVGAVSLVESYRAQFAPVLREGGMRYLIERLKSHNDHSAVS